MVTRGGGGSRQTVTNGDKGGRGVKNWDFYGDILFEWPQRHIVGRVKFVFHYSRITLQSLASLLFGNY